jgi:hypothetical protein
VAVELTVKHGLDVGGTTSRDDGTEAFDTNPLCSEGFTAGADEPYGSLNSERACDVVTLKFTAPAQYDRDTVLGGPIFSRKVDCTTLRVPSQGETAIREAGGRAAPRLSFYVRSCGLSKRAG